jgi:transglutaminase-like putative cysteine protease
MEISPAPDSVKQDASNDHLLDWRAALLAIAIVEISSARLVVTEWTHFLYFTQTMGFIGVILGLALGISVFSRQTVIRLSAGYTLLLIPVQLLSATERTDLLWRDIAGLFARLFISFGLFIRNQPVDDPIFFVSIVTLAYWIIGLSAGYWLTRHRNFLNVVLPSGLAILIVQAFDSVQSKYIWELGLFIFVSLLLLGRVYFLQNHSFWKRSNFLLTDEAINDLERGALVVTAIAVFIAWSLPGWISNIKPAARAWREFSQPLFQKFSNAVSALDSPYTRKNTSGDFYGSELALGQKAATGNTPVFTVEVKENEFVPVRNYWKGRAYDLYLNGRWTNSLKSSNPFIPTLDELIIEYPNDRHEMEYTFINSTSKQTLLYTAAETIWVSRNADVVSAPVSDVTAWVATSSLLKGSTYTVRALIADPSIEELRLTGTEYPEWVTDRYLQIPENIAPQLKELATEITAPYDTAYDKVEAITDYLRKEIEYTTEITRTLPKNKDPLLWVLFDYKKGFCMYYASAETLMLRSIGIPARMAVGFAQGTVDNGYLGEKYTVTYKDAHAWPEVYFPGIGWVEFEPTGNQAPIERPKTKKTIIAETTPNPNPVAAATHQMPVPLHEEPEVIETDNSSNVFQIKLYKNMLITALVLLALGFSIFITRRYSLNERLPVYLANNYERRGNVPPRWLKNWIRWISLAPIERAFQAINLSLFWLGHPQAAHITSQERAEVLTEYLPSAQDQTRLLLQEYHKTLYTPRTGNTVAARRAAMIILLKTWQTWIKKALQFPDTRYNRLK